MNLFLTLYLPIILSIVVLFIIYRQKEVDENYFVWKLIGYHILGSFKLVIQKFPLPLGFLVFLVFFHPTVNARAKRNAALFGLVVFFISVLAPLVANAIYERPIKIEATETNVQTIDLSKDYSKLASKLEIPQDVRINGFNVEYEKNGEIKLFYYELISQEKNGIVLYRVDYEPQAHRYNVARNRLDQWTGVHNMMPAREFFDRMDQLPWGSVKADGESDWYTLRLYDEHFIGVGKDIHAYELTKNGAVEMSGDKAKQFEAVLVFTGMEILDEIRSEGRDMKWLFFNLYE